MPQLELTINSRKYTLACDTGQETRLVELGDYINTRLVDFTAAMGTNVPESKLLLLLALTLADEMLETKAQAAAISSRRRHEITAAVDADLNVIAQKMQVLADRMNAIAEQIAA